MRFLKKIGKKRILNIGFYLSASLIGAGIQLVTNPFLALYLEHEDYAITGYFGSFGSLLSPFIVFSLVAYYSRNFFILDEAERIRLKNTLILSLLFFSALMSVVSVLSLYLFFNVNNVSLPFFPYALLSVSSIFLNNFYVFMLTEYKMLRRAKSFFKISLAHSIFAVVLSVCFVIIFQMGAFGKMLATTLTALVFGFICVRKLLDRWEFDKNYFKAALLFSWPLTIAAMLNYFFTGVDRAMLEGLNDTYNLGLYNIGVQIAGYLALFGTAISQTFQPDIYESIAKKNTKKVFMILGGITLLNMIPILVFIVFAPFIVKVLTFDRFTDAADFARIISLKNITSNIYFSLSTVIIGYGYSKTTLINKIIGSIVSLYMFKLLIDNFGYFGAAWGQVASFVALSLISFSFILFILMREKNIKKDIL
ncbi:MAG: oligosaccharide flippase family protein [Desulfobacterium sp.]|nr:oligosaccharide flippase family protein [Desulfobacterium sp.]